MIHSCHHLEPELPAYAGTAQSADFETGSVDVQILRNETAVVTLQLAGRAGMNAAYVRTVGYSPDADAGCALPSRELATLLLGALMFNHAAESEMMTHYAEREKAYAIC